MASQSFSKACGDSSRVNDGSGEKDHCREAFVGFVGTQGDALELLELAKEVLDEVSPRVELAVEWQGPCTPWVLGDDDLGATFVDIGNDGIAVEGLVGDQPAEIYALQKWLDADRVEAVPRHQMEAHKIAECIGQREDLGGHAAFGAAYGLALSPLLRPVRGGGP